MKYYEGTRIIKAKQQVFTDLSDFTCIEDIANDVRLQDIQRYKFNPSKFRQMSLQQQFVAMCSQNLAFAARWLIGSGDFELLPFQIVALQMLWNHTLPMLIGTRGMGKTFLLAVYALLKAILQQDSQRGHKIVIVSASFRQSKNVFNQINRILNRSPLLLAAGAKAQYQPDQCKLAIGNSQIIAVPMGDGQKIRGLRANVILVDQFASINEQVFNVVVRGFASVSKDPVANVKRMARVRRLRNRGEEGVADAIQANITGNQIIITGTASLHYNHFYKKYLEYKTTLQHKLKGRLHDFVDVLGPEILQLPNQPINYQKYALMRLPYTMMPRGFMDEDVIADAARASQGAKAYYEMEYMAKFVADTDGFFSLQKMQQCTPRPPDQDAFVVQTEGAPNYQYVMGVDPARKKDNFAISILKLLGDGRYALVYAWTQNNKDFTRGTKKIRELLRKFNIIGIGIDQGGGGLTIRELLYTKQLIPQGEQPIWDAQDPQHEGNPGRHLTYMINYQGNWLVDSNYDLKADMQFGRILFPFDAGIERFARKRKSEDDSQMPYDAKAFQQADEAFYECLKTKQEISKIVKTHTIKGSHQHFDLPQPGAGKQNPDRKDRYSALLIASYLARKLFGHGFQEQTTEEAGVGGWVQDILEQTTSEFDPIFKYFA